MVQVSIGLEAAGADAGAAAEAPAALREIYCCISFSMSRKAYEAFYFLGKLIVAPESLVVCQA